MKNSYLFINGIRVHYLQWGNYAAKHPIILLHGLASNARIWELTAPYLEDLDCKIIAPDARSHGLTDSPDGEYDFETFLGDLVGLIDVLAIERPVIIGHSWGANRALDYAARIPIGPRSPAGIILLDGGMGQLNQNVPGYPPPSWENVRERLTPPRLAGTSLDELTNRLKSMISAWEIKPVLHHQIVSIILENFSIYLDEASGLECVTPHLPFEKHLQIVRSLWEFQTFEHFNRLRCPVLMVPARPRSPRTLADDTFLASKEYGISQALLRLKDLQVHWLEDTIHDVPLQRPTELSAQIAQFCGRL